MNKLPNGGLTPEQVDIAYKAMVPNGVPVRFQYNGQTVSNLQTGSLHRRGINVIHQTVYWMFTRETSEQIAKWIGCKAVW